MSRQGLRPKKSLQKRCNIAVPQQVLGVIELSSPEKPPGPGGGNQGPVELEMELLTRGIRMTPQRRTVLQVIEATPHCRNAGTIHRRAKKLNSQIHRVTVYRTLALLRRHGVIDEVGALRGCSQHSAGADCTACDQIEVTCLRCGKVIEFRSCLFDELSRCVENDCHFRVARAKLDIDGYCQACRI